ncbi:MAG TPA: HDIG domain-containing protein [Parachlamydiaceae bacterium]|nr:HDIG domain-containing protein [Parachlamydiaceae bacterium]
MGDRVSEIENYNELKFSKEQGFFDKSIAIRILIGCLFSMALFAILHFREVRVQVLELNTISPDYIVAETDVDFFDEEKTVILQQDLARDIGKIYEVSEKSIRQRRIELENYLIYNQDWRKAAKNNPFEMMFKGLDAVESVLYHLRFTDPRTIQKMKDVGIPVSNYLVYTPEEVDLAVILPEKIWRHIKKLAFPGKEGDSEGIQFIIGFLKNKTWTISEDLTALKALRAKIQAQVVDQYSHITAGSRVIDKGEKVTARHIAIMQAIKRKLTSQRNLFHPLTLLGSFMLTLILTAIAISYFRINHPKVLFSNRKLFLLVTIIVLTFAISKAVEFLLLNSQYDLIDVVRYPLLVPFASILLCSLMNPGIASFVSGFLVILLTLVLAFDRQGFMILNFAAALIAIFSTRTLRRRKEIFIVCGKAWICCVGIILAINFYQNKLIGLTAFGDILSTGISMLLTAILVVGLLPLLESAFRIMTDVTLMEYMDPNNDLLRRLTIEAPGTYQHSVVVGNLTEAAASAIGANGLFCRVATLYHDIGKMATPEYFTENQVDKVNMHQLLTPKESAQVIMAHVSEGVSLARKAGLPEQFIDIIKEHHGTTLVYYFYRKQQDLMGGDKSLVDEKDFRYAGPKPRSKESAIIMIADSVEAASRSLDVVTEDTLMALASRLIQDKAEDGQFDECLLTFEELAIVKSVLVKTLVAFAHARVKYPAKERSTESHVTIDV